MSKSSKLVFYVRLSDTNFVQLAVRHTKMLNLMIDAFESFNKCLPRFHLYLQAYGSRPLTESLKTGLIQYYTELIGHCQDSIQFLSSAGISVYILLPNLQEVFLNDFFRKLLSSGKSRPSISPAVGGSTSPP